MQISGFREFATRIAPPAQSIGGQNKIELELPGSTSRQRRDADSVQISEAGWKLFYGSEKQSALAEGVLNAEKSGEPVADEVDTKDTYLEILDEDMVQAEGIIKEMLKLAADAQNEDLEDIDRVNLQIEFEALRERLSAIPKDLVVRADGGAPIAVKKLWDQPVGKVKLKDENGFGGWGPLFGNPDPEGDGDGSSVLGRMATRIVNGQEWNVREAWSDGVSRITTNDAGEKVEEVFVEGWYVVDDRKVKTQVMGDTFGHVETVETDKITPTVREVLEKRTPVILMDVESAVAGEKYLEEKLEHVQNVRKSVAGVNAELETKDPAALYSGADRLSITPVKLLYKTYEEIWQDPLYFNQESPAEATLTSVYLHWDGLYDFPIKYRMGQFSQGTEDSGPEYPESPLGMIPLPEPETVIKVYIPPVIGSY